MKILGLNFGHDAGVSLVVDGVFERHWEKERHVRIKHAMGLSAADILQALAYMDTSLADIDRVAVTCTQNIPIMLFGAIDLQLTKNSGWPLDGVSNTARTGTAGFFDGVRAGRSWYRHALGWAAEPPHFELLVNEELLGRRHPGLESVRTLDEIRASPAVPPGHSRRMCLGLEIRLGGRTIPGAYVSHHLCHAHYAYAESQLGRALVVTADGIVADSFRGGGIFFARDGRVDPIVPHALWIGPFYENIAIRLGLGPTSAGKLMGLAAWGKPRYHDEALVGNWFELPEKVRSEAGTLARDVDFGKSVFEYWRQRRGLEFSPGAALRTAQVPPDHAADIAASAQMTFERTMLKTAEAAQGIAQRAGFDYDAIVLAGGCALNCPANSLIHRRLGKRVFVPPAVNDEGNSAGAALALHGLLGNESAPRARRSAGQIAYKGRPYAAKRAEIEPFLAQVGVVKTDAPAVYLARRILRGAVAGIFEAGAEIGPRALGHRSLVASPQIADNWRKLNAIKGREQWRPLAPVVLPEDAGKYFEGFPEDSHYMLFNARVTADSLPAVTHRDGTARVQIAHPDNGFLFELLRAFKAISGCGVLINTSFNGPDEPIVETPGDALRSFVKLGFAFLYLDGIVVARRRAGGTGAPDRPAAPSSG